MRIQVPRKSGSGSDKQSSGPKPFSREWTTTPPEQRVPTQRQPSGPPPSWLPSERTASLILVAFLVLLAIALRSNLAPAIEAESTEIVYVTPITTTIPTTPTSSGLAANASSPTPSVTSEPESTLPTTALLPDYRIVAYYGHPNAATMGILGQYDKQDLLDQLTEEIGGYQRADPDRPVMPAFELIASVAQSEPQDDGSYLLQTDAATIQDYIDFTKANNMILILDIQMGRTSVKDEWKVVEPYMHEPNVHLAIDPEFAMGQDQIPLVDIGSVDADDVNYVQQQMSKIVKDDNLPPKVLIVHRFTDGMLTNSDKLKTVDDVQLVIDTDGFGDPPSKQATYELYARDGNVKFSGIKLFYDQDHPLMQPEEIVNLDPAPDFVMYQ